MAIKREEEFLICHLKVAYISLQKYTSNELKEKLTALVAWNDTTFKQHKCARKKVQYDLVYEVKRK